MNLTETKVALVKYVGIFIVLVFTYYILAFMYGLGKSIYDYFTYEPPKIVVGEFGKLPLLEMTSLEILGAPEYILKTEDALFPEFPENVLVYKFVQPAASLISEKTMKDLANDLYFDTTEQKLDAANFRWTDAQYRRIMNANVVSKQFSISTDATTLNSILSKTPSISSEDAKEYVLQFIKSKGLFTPIELDYLEVQTIPSNYNFGNLQDVSLFTDQSKIMKVDLYRNVVEIDDPEAKVPEILSSYRVFSKNPKDPSTTIYVTNHEDRYKIPLASVRRWEVDYESKSLYPISNVEAVWNVVKQNKGIIAHAKIEEEDYYQKYSPLEITRIELREVELAYYEPGEYTEYLQPIYVFKGVFDTAKTFDNELARQGEVIIYYPAVTGEWVDTKL